MAILEVDFDPTVWVEIPEKFPHGRYETVNEWSSSVGSMLASLKVEPDEGPDLPPMLRLLAQETGRADSGLSLACIPDGEFLVATVRVDLLEIEGAYEDLIEVFAARSSPLLTAAVETDEIIVAGLGKGCRIVRFQETDEHNSEIFVSVRFLWRTAWADVSIWFVTYDLPPAFPLAVLVEDLASGVAVRPDGDSNSEMTNDRGA